MSDLQPRKRRRHRSSPLRRVARSLGLDRGPARVVVVLAAVIVAGVALAVALGLPSGPRPSPAPSTAFVPSPTLPVIPTLDPSLPVIASGDVSLPPILTPSPSASSSAEPGTGIVARRIRIARLGINLRIVEGDGVDAPMNKAAHFPGTGWPGGGINIYLYGHAQKGMFLSLWDAKVGDEVLLDLVDGTTARYVVTQVKPEIPWNALQYTDPTPPERLSLQTSTSYTATAPRFLVIAEPAP
jgi:LPXTG-site transpeptidase (sortase) family protein